MLLRRLLKALAVIVCLAPFLLWLALSAAGNVSLAIVMPGGWILALVLFAPFVIAFVLWRLADLIKSSE